MLTDKEQRKVARDVRIVANTARVPGVAALIVLVIAVGLFIMVALWAIIYKLFDIFP